MKPLPHHYLISARGSASGSVTLSASGLPDLPSAPPVEYDGPGDQWSPESLLCAAVASCFVLTFRGIARASKLEWRDLECSVDGTLERVEGVTRFTRMVTKATLTLDANANQESCRRALEKAERSCLVTNSLRAELELHIDLRIT